MNNIVTGKVRFSYANVFEPRAMQNGGDPKYSITLLIPKNDGETYQKIIAEINRTLEESIADTFKGVRPANPRLPIYDGDGIRESGEPFEPECKGCWVISAKSNTAPEVVDANCQPILSKNEFYSGCYGRASIRFYAYNQNGNKGIGCGLGNVQKLEDGQPLDGRTTAAEDFGTPVVGQTTYQTQMQHVPVAPIQPQSPFINGQIDPISGQPIVNNVYGVN